MDQGHMNVYGPRADYKGAYIAVFIKMLDAIDNGNGPTIFGDDIETFDFVAVRDCGYANVAAMKADTADRFYNVSTGVGTSLNELASLLMELTGSELSIHYVPARDCAFVRNRIGDSRWINTELGFQPQTDLRGGLAELIAWRRCQLWAS